MIDKEFMNLVKALEFYHSYEAVQEKILFRLVHYGRNAELLKAVPHIQFLDLAVIFYCDVSEYLVSGTILVKKSHALHWGVSPEELYQCALKNTPVSLPPVIQAVEDVEGSESSGMVSEYNHSLLSSETDDAEDILDLIDEILWNRSLENIDEYLNSRFARHLESTGKQGREMYVFTNRKQMYGAAVMLYPQVLQKVADRLETDLYLLPCSVYEFIAAPDNGCWKPAELLDMVRKSNQNDEELDPDDVLSCSLYHYSRESGEITVRATILSL